jgi:hypothetical protein
MEDSQKHAVFISPSLVVPLATFVGGSSVAFTSRLVLLTSAIGARRRKR